MFCIAASACAPNCRSAGSFAHASADAAGRRASETSRSRPCGSTKFSTALRGMPMRASSACMANCGWPGDGARCLLSSPPIIRQASSSRSVSRPGSTTAPCGNFAMAAINSAVAGIEPVEPAAITGPSFLRASRAASALIRASRRVAASMQPRSFNSSGHRWRAICKNRSVSCQYVSNSSGTSLSSGPTARRASSCRRSAARDRRRAHRPPPAFARPAECRCAPCSSGALAHLVTSLVSKQTPLETVERRRQRQRFRPQSPPPPPRRTRFRLRRYRRWR